VSQNIKTHHVLEEELFRVRLLRDLRHPEFRPGAEDVILDRMEALWAAMSDLERMVLEAQRSARFDAGGTSEPSGAGPDLVDVERHHERSMPPRISPSAA